LGRQDFIPPERKSSWKGQILQETLRRLIKVGGGRRVLIWCLAFLLLLGSGGGVLAAPQFTDLEGHWAREAVEELVDMGLLQGYGDGTFRPQNPITRGQFIRLLVAAAGIPQEVQYPPTFSDVNITDPLYSYVEAAARAGIVSGDGGRFWPDRFLNREQLAVMVIKALDEEREEVPASILASFSDAGSISSWALSAVGRAVELGILSGREGRFAPQAVTTRAEAAVVIWNIWKQEGGEDLLPEPGDDRDRESPGDSLAVISPTKLELTFSRPVDTKALKPGLTGNFTLLERNSALSPGPVQKVEAISDTQVILTVPELYRDREYTLLARDIRTPAGLRLSSEPLAYHFRMDVGRDTPEYTWNDFPPEVTEVRHLSGPADKVEVLFSKPVTPETAERTRNYEITLAEDLSRNVDIEEAVLEEDGMTVTLTLEEVLHYEEGYRFFIRGVKDYVGREMIPQADYFRLGSEPEENQEDRAAVRTLSAREIEIVFPQRVRNQFQPSNYGVVEVSTGAILPVVAVEEGSRPYSVRLYLREEMVRGQDYLVSAGRGILDMDNEPIGTFTDRITAEFDRSGPRVEKLEPLDRRTFCITFDKPVYRLDVELSGFDFDIELYGRGAIVEAKNRQFSTGQSYRLSIRAEGEGGSSSQTKTLKFSSSVEPPEVKDIRAATSHLVLVEFDKPVLEKTATRVENYRFTNRETEESFYPSRVEYDPVTFTAHLTLPANKALADTRYYLQVRRVEDLAGNSIDDETYRFIGVDTVPPLVYLPPLTNNKSYLLVLADEISPGTDYLYGEPGALEKNVYVKVSIDGEVAAVGQAGSDGSLEKLTLGDLYGSHTVTLQLIDGAGNYASSSRAYNFR
jgi:hypothetical protein